MVLDDHGVAAAGKVGAGIVKSALVDGLDLLAGVARRTGKRRQVNDAYDRLFAPEKIDERVASYLPDGFHCPTHVFSSSDLLMMSEISTREG